MKKHIDHLIKLRTKKDYRYEHQSVVILGQKMIQEVSKITPIKSLLTLQDVSLDVLKKISGVPNPEGVIAEVAMPKFQDLKDKTPLLILDRIRNPGNLGTLLRTALALGFQGAHLVECVDPFNDKALRAAKGATFSLPLSISDLHFQGNLYTADLEGEPINLVSFQPPFAIILSSESHGVDPKRLMQSKRVAIPMKCGVDSLNVAAAGAIFMYASLR